MELNDVEQTKVGDLSFKGLKEDGSVEIGYGFNETYWNKGYALEKKVRDLSTNRIKTI
ncbi:hypothetical protein [Macrococcus animalis]|uniref:hypothetical protein n=1 Tax=Macrococcus animalis TaxID=3395467 RepID=UPI0039BDD367